MCIYICSLFQIFWTPISLRNDGFSKKETGKQKKAHETSLFFFIFHFLPYTELYALPFLKIYSSVSAHTCPFRQLRWHLPRQAGTAYGLCSFLFRQKSVNTIPKRNSLMPSFLSGGNQERWQANCIFRSVATRKHNETLRLWPGSAEQSEAIGARVRTQVRAFKSYNLCPDSSLRSRMTGKYLMLLRKKPFFRFCSHLPLPSASLTPSPTSGDGLRFVFFSF